MQVVDAHHHLWDPRIREYPFLAGEDMRAVRRPYDLDELRVRCRRYGVSQTVLVQTVSSVEETREFLRIAEHSDGLIGGVVGWVDLEDEAMPETLESLRRGPGGRLLVGIRHQAQDEVDDAWLARPRVVESLRQIAAAGLCFDLLVTPTQLTSAVASVRAVPEGRFVLDHIGKPALGRGDYDVWAAGIRNLAELPHVACKLSGLVSLCDGRAAAAQELRPFTDKVLALFDPGRLMVGSDWPICDAVASYGDVLVLAQELTYGVSEAQRSHLFGVTARDFYRLTAVR